MITQLPLKYGCNPNQTPARLFIKDQSAMPFVVLSGNPGYINFLDAFNGYQLVSELKTMSGLPAAASFKHVSPAGAALGLPLSDKLKKACFVEDIELSPLANAYARARGADRMSSFGDFIALSDCCDEQTAALICREVSDGVIAPAYSEKALEILRKKRNGKYNILQMDAQYTPSLIEQRDCFGITFEQQRNDCVIDQSLFVDIPTKNKTFTDAQKCDLLLSLITLKYTQSNSVCYAFDGQAIGIGAGQQSRIHCTRLAGNKADLWFLRQHDTVLSLPFVAGLARAEQDNAIDVFLSEEVESLLADGSWQTVFTHRPTPLSGAQKRAFLSTKTGVSMGSDAFFPFGDNITRAHRSGVCAIIQPGGSIRDDHVIAMCDQYGIAMVFSGQRLFHH